jgi:exonuclease VII large subunit
MLGEEEMLLLQLIKVIQKDCFENNRLSMEEYNEAMSQYEGRLSEIIQARVTIESQIANLMKFRGKRKALKQEKDRLLMMVRQVQDDYLNRDKIETRAYENMLKTYSSRLSNIQEELAFMDAKEEIARTNTFWKRLVGRG